MRRYSGLRRAKRRRRWASTSASRLKLTDDSRLSNRSPQISASSALSVHLGSNDSSENAAGTSAPMEMTQSAIKPANESGVRGRLE